MVTQSVTLDGSNSVTVFGRSFNWVNDNLQIFNIYAENGATSNTLNITFAGSPWAVDSMTFNSSTLLNVNITEANDGISRYVESMRVINGNVTISLADTFVQSLRVGDPGLGSTLNLTLGQGGAGVVRSFDGNDTVTLGSGFVELLSLGDGNNTVDGGTDGFGSIHAGGNNAFNLAEGGESIRLGDGNNNVTLNAGTLDTLFARGDDTITLLGDARILLLKMDQGVNRLTSENGNIESIYAFHAKNIIHLGSGGAQQIVLSGSAASQMIKSDGFIGSLQIYAGDQTNVQATNVVTGEGGAGYIQTSKGNDQITGGLGKIFNILTFDGNDTVKVGTGGAGSIDTGADNDTVNLLNGFADWVSTGDGNDTLIMGQAGGRFIALGGDDDTISLVALPAAFGITIDGDEGSDTVNLSRFNQGLTVALDQGGNFQDFGVSGVGFFLLHDMENLIGTAKADDLTGSLANNRLSGGLGADKLSGLEGDDQLIGGRGNDILTGNAGLDTFLFAAIDGIDRITDFTVGDDHIDIAGTRRLTDISFTQVGLDVRLTVGTLQVLVEDMTVANLRVATNFDF